MFKFYPRYIAIKILKIYQKTLSFDYGILKFLYPNGFCRFCPTCSDYAIQAVEKYGFIKGGIKAVWRVLRCNPFNSGGMDPLK
ncbi:membrane protein insertion efficiency factor YidD [Patescibacteria group bacterium]|nr:membrane protein insertion efficiency factor YidD [Patescibacteria group bacterium]MBU1663200.1 membrane protein insertion efficiency factor YidD [Patescibacteria group bacterium]MBU1933629.1 membrane protein insertion efficiency factor YidD [Patescibacteria group bacterium]MBU2007789.1 membrane protein insertion efficiency factor YidD [Patescibacteria group bacterium]MBU2233776.1 membrane protein insertion efficiency factor YidD [Patescibacteria group bacterium]